MVCGRLLLLLICLHGKLWYENDGSYGKRYLFVVVDIGCGRNQKSNGGIFFSFLVPEEYLVFMFRVFAGRELIHSGDFVIFKEDGIRCNYAFYVCNQGKGIHDFYVTQLISVPGKPLHMYRKRGRIEDNARVDELLEEWDNVDEAVNRSVKLLEKLTGNEFEIWERAKQFKKKMHKFMSIDIV